MPIGCLAVFLTALFLVLLPIFMAETALLALTRLGLSAAEAVFVLLAMLAGGAVNLPIRRWPVERQLTIHPQDFFGLSPVLHRAVRVQDHAVLAVNVGGCLVPGFLVLYEVARIVDRGPDVVLGAMTAVIGSIGFCWIVARPIPRVGIAVPSLLPPLVSALLAGLLAPDFAPPIAFVAGVMGPLVGADLLHLGDLRRVEIGMASIGGAGTFDAIVVSGLLATLLA